jgi:ABC-type transport system involved in cytochrome bd biosynthesis fused ATPase/permease subunit
MMCDEPPLLLPADLIFVISGGRIAESGGYQTLMVRDGLYAELFTFQATAYRQGRSRPPLSTTLCR